MGREFWRGMRGGGDSGAKTFRVHCFRELDTPGTAHQDDGPSSQSNSVSVKQTPARSLKNELYDGVRKALRYAHCRHLSGRELSFCRLASGIRNAEMKWTSPEKLDLYGVRLVGWPSTVPSQNPSSLKFDQNKLLLEALENGTMRFESSIVSSNSFIDPSNPTPLDEQGDSEDLDFSWAYDADGGNPPVCFCLIYFFFTSGIYFCQNTSQDLIWEHSSSSSNTNTANKFTGDSSSQPSSRKRPRREG